jgi:pSer/pThr/pTyr-binding forkhead associated (FHA) protein
MWVINGGEHTPDAFTFRISPGAIKTIGRAPRADFIVDAALVSRVHCQLSAGAAELEVVDLDSTNGTFVNGQRVERALLKTGDQLGVGKVLFVVSRGADAPRSETDSFATPARSSSAHHDPIARSSPPEN